MKRCPKHYWFEYDETQGGCQLCEREALKARTEQAPADAIIDAEPTIIGHTSLDDPQVRVHEPEPQPEPEPEQPPEPIGLSHVPFGRTDFVTAPTPQVERGPEQAREWEAAPAPDPMPAAPPEPAIADPVEDEDTRILNQLSQLRENGVFTVVLIGFYAGGKTWFLNRIKHELGRWGFNLSPPPARDKERVIRTVNVEIHHARRLKDDAVRGFALVDIPGERLTRLVAKDFRSVRSVIAAMDMCGALIVALPADEVLLSEDIHREAQAMRGVDHVLCKRTADNPELHQLALKARELVVEAGSVEDALGQQGLKAAEIERIRALGEEKSEEERQKLLRLAEENEALEMLTRVYRLAEADAELSHFTQDLCFMTGLMSKLKQEGRRVDATYNFGALQAGEVDTHISSLSYARFTRPTFVAMTKADLVSHPDPLLEALIKHSRKPDIGIAFDEDPLDTVREMRASLASMFEQWFANSKFDFVTAFHQHRHTDVI
ncbi:MAG TPA: hypothetical protein VGB54_02095, partial [Allosphingosinicella sp.]